MKVGKLSKVLGIAILAPSSVYALSIGDIQLNSALNQNLNAEIRLHVDAGEDPRDIAVRVAAPEKFDRAGVPWSYFLSKIKFESSIKSDNTIVVRLTSQDALTEPFLDVLLEVVSAEGSQYKEFPLLIDPPSNYNNPQFSVADNSNFHEKATQSLETTYSKPSAVVSRHHSQRRHQAQPALAADTNNANLPINGEFGPTKSMDSLWQIAKKVAAEQGVTPHQMMAAIHNANPEAFVGNNINALKLGVKLKIPAVGSTTLAAEKSKANTDGHKPPLSNGKPLELLSPVDANSQTGNQIASDQSGSAANAQSTDGKSVELQTRIEKLEQQLGLMQQLLTLKDQQLSELQNTDKASPQTTPSLLTVQSPVAEPVPVKAEPAPVPPQQTTIPLPVVAQPLPIAQTPTPAPAPAPAPDQGLFTSDSYYLSVAGVGFCLLSVLGWLWWRKRTIDLQTSRESMFANNDQISMPELENSLSIPILDMENSAAFYDVGMVGESSFISDFTPSDFDAFDTEQNEVDPLSEADVYLAYGRYQQAEELIRHAINQEPEKDVYKLKLLEVFYAGENKQGFSDYVQELVAKGKQDDRAFWSKVTEMAQEIVVDLPVLGGTVDNGLQATNLEQSFISSSIIESIDRHFDNNDFEMEASDFNDSRFTTSLDSTDSNPTSLDFTVTSHEAANLNEKIDQPKIENSFESIEFDLGDLSFNDASEKVLPVETENSLDAFDFKFDIETLKPIPDKINSDNTIELEHEQTLQLEDDYFADADLFAGESLQMQNESEQQSDDVTNQGGFDFNFDFNMPVTDNKDEFSEYDLGVADLTDMDEFETKIDLAKAYIDMGDAETAKLIAEEVLNKGNSEQKTLAKTLLDEINSV
ncbi:FimV/HubP family polar landmark protein [Methylomonas sp. AM2-LC]|uniref:FimV/HubP family polar landmark protein n=1 Tax=Methylomonas sp. AM2-LC TaxID=3153301 RepID=UPI003265CCCA